MSDVLKVLLAAACVAVIGGIGFMVWPHQPTIDERMNAIDQRIITLHQLEDALSAY